MLHVLSLDGATVATLDASSELSGWQIRDIVNKNLGESRAEAFDLVFDGHMLHDGDLLSNSGEMIVTIVWRSSPKIVTASKDVVSIFDSSGQKLQTCDIPQLVGVSFSPDGSLWLGSTTDGSVLIYDTDTGEKICSLKGSRRRAHNATFSPDSSMVLVPSPGCTALLYDARTGESLGTCCGFHTDVRLGIFSPDSSMVLLVSQDGFASLFSTPSGSTLRQMSEVGKWNSSVHFFSSSDLVLTVLRDGTGRIFDTTGCCRRTFRESGWLSDAALSPDDSKVLLVLSDCTARIYEIAGEGKISKSIALGDLGIYISPYPVCFSRSSSKILLALDSCEVKVVDSCTGDVICRCKGGKHHITSASFSPDGSQVLVSYYNSIPKIFDSTSGACLLDLPEHPSVVFMASFS